MLLMKGGGLTLSPAMLGHEMLSIHVAALAQSAQKRSAEWGRGPGPGQIAGRQNTKDADLVNLSRRLGAGHTRRCESPEGETAVECASVHH